MEFHEADGRQTTVSGAADFGDSVATTFDGEDAPHVTSLSCGASQCHILGVCHLSEKSVVEARHVVESLRPSMVLVELCEERAHLLEEAGYGSATVSAEALPPLGFSMFRDHWARFFDPIFWVLQLQLLALEALVGTRLGAEQVAAFEAARAVGANVMLADRHESVTIGRTLAAAIDVHAIWQLLHSLYGSSSSSDIAKEAAQLELLLLNKSMSAMEFAQASALARRIIDRVMNSAEPWNLGRAGEPIQEERDYLLSHTLFHAGCDAQAGSHVVAVFGAAHIPGVVQHFNSFASEGCSARQCGVMDRVQALNTFSSVSLFGAAGVLLLASSAGLFGRWALVRRLRRTRGELWARRFNRASIGFSAGLGCFGVYRACRQYEAVRKLQLHRDAARGRHHLATF